MVRTFVRIFIPFRAKDPHVNTCVSCEHRGTSKNDNKQQQQRRGCAQKRIPSTASGHADPHTHTHTYKHTTNQAAKQPSNGFIGRIHTSRKGAAGNSRISLKHQHQQHTTYNKTKNNNDEDTIQK